MTNQIEIHQGDALDIINKIGSDKNSGESFDFVFIDADKERYIQYFDAVFPLVKPGGIIGADNILSRTISKVYSTIYTTCTKKSKNQIRDCSY